MECFRVWVFSLFEHKLLGGIGGSHDFFCAGLSNPEVAVVQCSSSLLPAVPINSRSPSCIRLCLIEGITVLFWTLGFSECSSAKSKAIQRKTESTYAARFFLTVTMSGGLIFGPIGLYFPLYTSRGPVAIKAGTQPVTCRPTPGHVVKQRDWDD